MSSSSTVQPPSPPTGRVAFVTGGSGFLGRALIPALLAAGFRVRALARSAHAQATVQHQGATPVPGDLADTAALRAGCTGASLVVHSAAYAQAWGPIESFQAVNVQGTRHVLDAARAAGVGRVVHISTESVLLDGRPLVRVTEDWPLPERAIGMYPDTKLAAERLAVAANAPGFEVMVIRPRFIWGRGDTTVLPLLREMVAHGRFSWINGGEHLTSTCHVRNVCEGVLLAAERGRGGAVYHVTDGEPQVLRTFVSRMLATQGVVPPTRNIPLGAALAAARAAELAWRWLPLSGEPPATRAAVLLIGQEMTISDARARQELGYVGRVGIDEGLMEMAISTLPPT